MPECDSPPAHLKTHPCHHHPALWSVVLCCALSLCLQSAVFPVHFSHQHYVKFIINNYALICVFGCTFKNILFTVYLLIPKMCFYYYLVLLCLVQSLSHTCHPEGACSAQWKCEKTFESTFIHCMVTSSQAFPSITFQHVQNSCLRKTRCDFEWPSDVA